MEHPLVAFIIVIGILVFIHEFGHFIAARLCGVGVQVFSLGFGPKLLKKTVGRTEYCLSAIPLGGYVKMVGDEPGAELAPEDLPLSFTHKSLIKKSIIVAAGPVSNFILAIVIFFGLYNISGIYLPRPVVEQVQEGSPALIAGIKPGDVIRQINNEPVESFEDVSRIITQNGGSGLTVVVSRNDELVDLYMQPELRPGKNEFGEDIQRYVIGIVGAPDLFHKRYGILSAANKSITDTYGLVVLTARALGKIFTGSVSAKTLGGPLMIAQMAGEQAKQGVKNFAFFIALLSVNLGIINLFPIPVLDGGHLLFFAVEGVMRRPVSDKVREKMIQVGAAMLVALMVFVLYNDFVRLFSGK